MSAETKNGRTIEPMISLLVAGGIIVTLILSAVSTCMMKSEYESRVRPWVGITGVSFEAAPDTHAPETDNVIVSYDNVGALPAQDLHFLQSSAEIREDARGPDDQPISLEQTPSGVVFPNEPSGYNMRFPGMADWRRRDLPVIVQGTIAYESSGKGYKTEFEVSLDFEHDAESPQIRWRNTNAQ